jgi:endonuclease-3 related protein
MKRDSGTFLMKIYRLLRSHFGFLNWWPASTPLEMAIGAILTQNVAWSNVERSITNLKNAGLLNLDKLLNAPPQKVKKCIAPSGYYNVKYIRLLSLLKFIRDKLEGDIKNLSNFPLDRAREMLLNVRGVGKETADSILLYGAHMPIFVVDAYTKRAFYRLGVLGSPHMDYDEIQAIFMKNLKRDVLLFNDYHAQIVELGKNYCKKSPLCEVCPLNKICKHTLQ